jgi:hypothetical protein
MHQSGQSLALSERMVKATFRKCLFQLEPLAELMIASTKNPLGPMASLGVPMGFMASHGAVWQVLNDMAACRLILWLKGYPVAQAPTLWTSGT